jgi:hypothetical protein
MNAWTHHEVPKRQMRNLRVATTTSKTAPEPAHTPAATPPPAPVQAEPDPELWIPRADWDEFFELLFEIVNPHVAIKTQLLAGMKRIDARKEAEKAARQRNQSPS